MPDANDSATLHSNYARSYHISAIEVDAMRRWILLFGLALPLAAAAGRPPDVQAGGAALNSPDCVKAPEARSERDDDEELGVGRNGEFCAYPVRMMAYHRVVNDHLGGPPIVVAYDPDSGVGQVFDPVVDGKERHFDAAGPRKGVPTIRDRETQSAWSLLTGEALEGPLAGRRLERIQSMIVTWKRWRA